MRKRKSGGGGEQGGANWMDTYGDLVTLLLTFFVLLFASSSIDVERWQSLVLAFTGEPGGQVIAPIDVDNPTSGGISSADGVQSDKQKQEEAVEELTEDEQTALEAAQAQLEEQFNALYEQLNLYVQNQGLQESLLLSKDGLYISLTIAEGVLFDSGSADIRGDQSGAILTTVGDILHPFLSDIQSITIEGHTDTDPIKTAEFQDNFDLSSMRANNVVRYMSAASDIPESTFISIGRSEWDPIAPNDTAENKQKNRRVNIIVVAKDLESITPPPEGFENAITVTSE